MSFVTAINCIDGRTQAPLITYLRERWNASYVDMITEPAPAHVLAQNRDRGRMRSIYDRVDVSMKAHGSKHLAIVAHHDCAAFPEGRDRQADDIHRAVLRLSRRYSGVHIIGLWLDENFQPEEISHADPNQGPRKSFSMESRNRESAGFDIGAGRGMGDQGGARTESSHAGPVVENNPIQDEGGGGWIVRAAKAIVPLVLMLALSRFLTDGGDDNTLRQGVIVFLVIGFFAWRIIQRIQRSNEETA